nr:arylsulfatase I [Onthophagus taurus]
MQCIKYSLKQLFIFLFLTIILSVININGLETKQPPHIIFILADDLGFNDVGFHGSSQIPTPNIDILAYSGIILNNYYVSPICTPSRSALMTGKHPIHLGTQHGVLYGAEPRGLSLSEAIMPEFFQKLGYKNRIVGKWHLGSWKLVYTPTFRGFDSHLGFWTGHLDYNDHTAMEKGTWGLDMRNGTKIAYNLHGEYITSAITKECVKIIENHNENDPLFLYIPHAAVHSGNPYNPLAAPDETVAELNHILDYNRRRFAAMMVELDKSVGEVITSLSKKNMLQNSIIIFSTDNGGPAAGFNLNAASNFPLKGVKNTLWEGGVRGAGFLWSPLLNKTQRVSQQMMHITDWLPTLITAAGGDRSLFTSDIADLKLDGKDLWKALSENKPSPRNEILHNIDDVEGNSALTLGEWKIIKGSTYKGQWDNWYGPSGRSDVYNVSKVLTSKSAVALEKIGKIPSHNEILNLRNEATVTCSNEKRVECSPLIQDCLFNIKNDPCETINLAEKFPSVLKDLQKRISDWNTTAVPPGNLPVDPRGDPKYFEYVWTNFGDHEYQVLTS